MNGEECSNGGTAGYSADERRWTRMEGMFRRLRPGWVMWWGSRGVVMLAMRGAV